MLTVQKRWFGLAAAAVMSGAAANADAAFVTPSSWDRGNDGTTYQEWDVFAGTTDAAPDVASTNPNGTASVSENGGNGAFLTSGGNIYSFSAPTDFTAIIPEADVPTPPHDVTAIVQLHTLGEELDYDSVLLNGLAPVDTAFLDRDASETSFGTSAEVDSWFLFNVPYADFGDGTAGVEDLTLTFNAAGSSLSLDRLAVDTAIRPFGFYAESNPAPGNPIPEPASLALLGLGGTAMLLRRRASRA